MNKAAINASASSTASAMPVIVQEVLHRYRGREQR